MKFQPFTVLTKTRWISFLKVALLSASWVSSSHFFPHQILPSRALVTAWQSPLAWRPLCFSPSPWPPCLQTQSKTGCPEEPVQSCHPPPSTHRQNQSRKLKDRSQLMSGSWKLRTLQITWLWWFRVLPAGCEVLWLSSDVWRGCWKNASLWVLCPAHEGRQQKHGRSLYFWRNKITFSFVFKLDLFKTKQTNMKPNPCKHDFWREIWLMLQETIFYMKMTIL